MCLIASLTFDDFDDDDDDDEDGSLFIPNHGASRVLEPFRLVGTFLQTGSLVTQTALKTPWKRTTSCMEQEVEVFLDCAASC